MVAADLGKRKQELREELLNADDRKPAAVEAPLFADFAQEFIDTYATPNNKPSEVESKRMILRVHLVPLFGNLRLDQIGIAEIDSYKAKKLAAKVAHKTINNHLTVLGKFWPKERHLELSPKYWAATRSNLDPVELDTWLCPFTVPPVALNFAR